MSDDLTQIKGIGPVRAADLAAQGIETFAALAATGIDAAAGEDETVYEHFLTGKVRR